MRLINLVRQQGGSAARAESGQMAWAFVLVLLFVFMIFAVTFDAGLWFFDHRTAQNQAEAAALAAVQDLPSSSTVAAELSAIEYLGRNGVNPATDGCSPDWIIFEDVTGEGDYDQVTVCLSRNSSVVFSAISKIASIEVSASATALIGRTELAQVMPWTIVPPDPTCVDDNDPVTEECMGDLDADGVAAPCDFDACPWGLNPQNLFRFKSGGGGNTGIIDACGQGAVNYRDCINGETASGFFDAGETVEVGLQGGNLGVNTDKALNERYAQDAADGYPCDVLATPQPLTGFDPDGRLLAHDYFGGNALLMPELYCDERLVLIPILASLPAAGGGSASLEVLGVAVFGIAAWNHDGNQSTYGFDGIDSGDGPLEDCAAGIDNTGFECGMVWGYLMEDMLPPDYLLQKITNSDNPFAPLLIALVE